MKDGIAAWRKDAKWICAIALVLVLMPSLTMAGLYRINAPVPAQNLLKTLILTSGLGSDIETEYNVIKRAAKDSPGEMQQITTLFDINLNSVEILKSTAGQFKEKLAGDIARRIYRGQVIRGSIAKDVPFFGVLQLFTFFLSEPAHQGAGALAAIFTVLAVIFAVLTVSVSTRFGRPASLGLALIFGSLPNVLIFSALGHLAEAVSPALLDSQSIGRSFAGAAVTGLSQAELFLVVGVLLTVVSIGGGITIRLRDAQPTEAKRELSDPAVPT